MSCGTRLGAYLDGELCAAERSAIETHLGSCAACAEELRRIAAASAAVKAWRPGRRGVHGLPFIAAAAALLAAAWALAPHGVPPRPGAISLRAGESVGHTGTREYVAEGLARPARIDCAGGALFASDARFRLEDSMRTGTKVGAAAIATAAVVIWGSIEWTDRAGRRTTLHEGAHELETPAAAESGGASGAVATEPPGDPFDAVTGVILLPDGSPAPEASVALTYPVQYAGGAPDQTTVSDAEGRFRFASAAKPFMLAAVKARVGAVSGYFTPGAHVVLNLRAGARVEGRLLDEVDGSPISDALVSSQMTGGVWGNARAVTGADGRFVLDGLDPDTSSLWIRPRAHLDLVVMPRLARGETVSLELRLARSVALRGQVVDGTTGAPVALLGVEVSSNPQRAARLLGDGRFEVMSQRWGTGIVVHAEGYPDTGFSFGNAFQAQGNPAREELFRIGRGVLLRLRARDETDRPIAGARVVLIRTGSYWGDLATAEDGDATARIPSGQDAWIALAQHARYAFEQTPIQPGRGGETVVPLLGRAAGTATGRVLTKDGRPAGGARIDVGQSQAYAIEDGRFRIGGLTPGRVEIRAQGADGAASVEADLRPLEETDVGDIVLRRGVTIAGFVTRPDGARIERYEVWAAGKGGTVEADGTFRLTGIEEGRAYEVHVRAGGVNKAVADVLAGTQGLEIRLDDYATIKGRVLAPEGDAVPLGLSMGCARRDSDKPVLCDIRVYMDGGFVIAGVPAGRYTVSASAEASSYARTGATVEVKAGATAEVDLRLVRGGTIEGTLASPLPPEKVMVRLESADPEGARVAIARDGGFVFQALAPGDYTVEAQTYEAGYRGTRQAIVVRGGETARPRLSVIATGELLVRAPAGTALSLLDAAGNAVEPAAAERRDLTRQLWEARGRPGKEARAELEADVERALLAADADGVWRRAALFPGEYVVAADDRRERVTVRAGQTAELDMR